MRKLYCLISIITMSIFSLNAQVETWSFNSYSVGSLATGGANTNLAGMPDVIQIGSTYYMYFGYGSPGNCVIKYATSADLTNWVIQGDILSGSSNPTDREYHMGGPRVVKLSNGQYRMFYRACENYATTPPYHCLSAISTDGVNFTREPGVRIEIKPHLPNSYFKRVAHSAFYLDSDGNMRAILTGYDTTIVTGPDKLYTAFSSDEGLTWSNFSPLYNNSHDPVVIKDGNSNYQLYFTYLNTGFRKATSSDGIVWPATPDMVYFIQGTDTLIEAGNATTIADLGGYRNSAGDVVLFSAYKTTLGPWTNIVQFSKILTGSDYVEKTNRFKIFPNPSNNFIHIQTNELNEAICFRVCDAVGRRILSGVLENKMSTIDVESLGDGMYYIHFFNDNVSIDIQRFMIAGSGSTQP